MKNTFKGLMLLLLAVIIIAAGSYLLINNYFEYAIVCYVVSAFVLIIALLSLLVSNKASDQYERELNNILKTYDSILAKTNNIPDLSNKNIIYIDKMEDLVDVELEVRKPICYFKQTESCSFILMDNDVAYIYIMKTDDSVVSPIENELNDVKIKQKDVNGIDSNILNSLEKTEIIKLPNNKSYKVSPVRKKQQESVIESPVINNDKVEIVENKPKNNIVINNEKNNIEELELI